jgi:transposase
MKPDEIILRLISARMTSILSERRIASLFGISRGSVYYWKKKLYNPEFRRKKHGRKRYQKFDSRIDGILRRLVTCYPKFTLAEFEEVMNKLNISIAKDTIRRKIKKWKISYKKAEYKQTAKFTHTNMQRYFDYIIYLPKLVEAKDLSRIKFLDEVHFVSKDLERKHGFAPLGKRLCVSRNTSLLECYSMTLLTTPDRDIPFACDLRMGSNNQYDFALFIGECIKNKLLVKGDVLILDNASVHCGGNTVVLLYRTLEKLGVKMLFLSAYSPELNPVELVFAKIKNYLGSHRDSSKPLIMIL